MAAGLGSRYGGMKQADPLGKNGEFIIDYSIFDAIRVGFDRVVLIIRPEHHEIFKSTIGKRISSKVKVDYAFQSVDDVPEEYKSADRTKPWGTVHAVLSCDGLVNDNFAVINADDFYGRQTFQVIADYLKHYPDADVPEFAMPGFVLANTLSKYGHVTRGVCLQQGGYLSHIAERKKIVATASGAAYLDSNDTEVPLDPDSLVSMNFWAFDKRVFAMFRRCFNSFLQENKGDLKAEYVISSAIEQCVSHGNCKVKVIPTTSKWFGVTYAEDRPEVVAMINSLIEIGEYPQKLF